jgi:hypothetical protein
MGNSQVKTMNSAKLKQQGKAKFEQDPLEKLNQVDREVVLSQERKALILMANMLDNFEEIDELKGNLEEIMGAHKSSKIRILSLFKTLIQELNTEQQFIEQYKIMV